ncbi:uncharacterized protein LOC122249059 [Penaeus japonicus]|uniref:uncharacterized protein LOC122249059 n=1 Tax=Penaeus japonicus TaxID=27405 RepID=UPI001C70CB4D|nr:uncharacterized protein LOC122249059 [Penaeus japonicus]
MNFIVSLQLALLFVCLAQGRMINERAISDEAASLNSLDAVCDSQSPCGWEIYGDLRRHVYYLRNECQCPPSTRCVMVEDDMLQEAYVYKCRRIPSRRFF